MAEKIHVRRICDRCNDAVPRNRPHDCKPTPAALSAEMLGEEDRQHLRLLREGLDDYWVTFPEHQSAIAFLDRLLGSADKGGE